MTQQIKGAGLGTGRSSHCSSDADWSESLVVSGTPERANPPHHPTPLYTSAGLGWFQKHLELFSVAALWGTWRHSCSHRLQREGGEGSQKLQQSSSGNGRRRSSDTTRSFMPGGGPIQWGPVHFPILYFSSEVGQGSVTCSTFWSSTGSVLLAGTTTSKGKKNQVGAWATQWIELRAEGEGKMEGGEERSRWMKPGLAVSHFSSSCFLCCSHRASRWSALFRAAYQRRGRYLFILSNILCFLINRALTETRCLCLTRPLTSCCFRR